MIGGVRTVLVGGGELLGGYVLRLGTWDSWLAVVSMMTVCGESQVRLHRLDSTCKTI